MLATDRCDRCGAQAYTGWWLTRAKGELLFCAHHDRQHEAALEAQQWQRLIDDRAALLKLVGAPEPEPA